MTDPKRFRVPLAVAIMAICVIGNSWLTTDPVLHVLLQLPLLGIAGWLATPRTMGLTWRWTNGGFAPLLLALFATAYWMLPRSIDGAVDDASMAIAKFITLPLVGVAVAAGWHRATPLLRGFVKSQTISMLGFMAFLFTHAPQRLCNNYLFDAQTRLGYAFLWLALGLTVIWVTPLFFPEQETSEKPHGPSPYSGSLHGVRS